MKGDEVGKHYERESAVKAAKLKRFFSTQAGKEALEILKEEFMPAKIVEDNPYRTAANGRAREIFDFIDDHLNY